MKFDITDIYFRSEDLNRSDAFDTNLTFYIKENDGYTPSYIDRLNFYQNLRTATNDGVNRVDTEIRTGHFNNLTAINVNLKTTGFTDDNKFNIFLILTVLREWLTSAAFCKVIIEIQSYINIVEVNTGKTHEDYELYRRLQISKYFVDSGINLLTDEEKLLLEVNTKL